MAELLLAVVDESVSPQVSDVSSVILVSFTVYAFFSGCLC